MREFENLVPTQAIVPSNVVVYYEPSRDITSMEKLPLRTRALHQTDSEKFTTSFSTDSVKSAPQNIPQIWN